MKISYSLMFVLLILMTSCINDYNDGKDNKLVREEIYDADAPRRTSISLDDELERAIRAKENPDRNNWQKPREVIRRLGDLNNKTVADIGAGYGYFSFQILQSAGKVIAIDIDKKAIDQIDSLRTSLREDLGAKLETRLVSEDDPSLKPEEVDIVFISNTYAYIGDKVEYLKTVYKGIKPGGRICIVDFKMKKLPNVFPPVIDRIPLFEVENQLEEAGFRHLFSDDQTLDYQYIVIAEKI